MRISDWSSDVCSSDLRHAVADGEHRRLDQFARFRGHRLHADEPSATFLDDQLDEAACVEVGKRSRNVVECQRATVGLDAIVVRFRSEEHTSELQSLMRISYAVFCLKKKKLHNIYSLSYTIG